MTIKRYTLGLSVIMDICFTVTQAFVLMFRHIEENTSTIVIGVNGSIALLGLNSVHLLISITSESMLFREFVLATSPPVSWKIFLALFWTVLVYQALVIGIYNDRIYAITGSSETVPLKDPAQNSSFLYSAKAYHGGPENPEITL